MLLLPPSDDGKHVDMSIVTRTTCFTSDVTASIDWLEGAPFKLGDVFDVDDVADLEMLCLDWERGLPSSTDG